MTHENRPESEADLVGRELVEFAKRAEKAAEDVRFSEWIDIGEDGWVELGLFSDIHGRADLQLRWLDGRWRTFWRHDDSWCAEDPEDGDLAAYLTSCFDWGHFNAYWFDSEGRRR